MNQLTSASESMKVLMLTPYLPYPLLSGGQIRTYNLLKNLSQEHEITLFALIKDHKEREYIKHIEPICSKIKVFKRTQNPWALRNILLAGLTAYPFLVTRNLPDNMKAAVIEELSNGYDLIHAETFYMMPNIPETEIPVLLVEQTIEHLGYEFYAKNSPHWFIKPLLYLDIAKIRYWEKHFWRKASRLVTMSSEDREVIHHELGTDVRIDVVANGVDIERFSKKPKQLPKEPTILFVGTFKWLPNIDAVQYLAQELWPGIKSQVPDAKLWIVGHSPTEEVLSLGRQPDVKVSANVADIRDAYAQAHVLVAPIRSGKGTRYKIIEAIATKTPVVTTSLGAEGLQLRPGKHVLIGDNTQSLIKQTVKLLKDRQLQETLANSAQSIVERSYNWQTISKDLDKLYRELGGQAT